MSAAGADDILQTLRLAVASHYSDTACRRWLKLAGSADLDWPAVARLASVHGLAPLLYSAILRDETPAPSETRAELRERYQLTAAMNTLAQHDLRSILSCLDDACVPVVLLKGAALLDDVYQSVALRPMIDLDLLIRYSDYPAAVQALGGIGYRTNEPEPFDNLDGLYWNEVLLPGEVGTRVQLELHWNLLDIPYYASRLPVESLMERAFPITVGDVEALRLSPIDLLIHLCAHNLYHHQGLMRRTEVDVAFVAHRYGPKIDWDGLVDDAVRLGLFLGVQETVINAAAHWFAPVPQSALDRVYALRPTARERAFAACQRSEFLKLLRTLVTLPGAGRRVRFVRGQLFPSRDYLAWRYGIPASRPGPLAYATRYGSGLRGLFAELSGRRTKVE